MNRTLSTIFAGDIFSSFFDGYTPSVRINETGTEYKLEMAVPGLTKSDLIIKSE
jgi:HSP20 family molecular chaperone IbpA